MLKQEIVILDFEGFRYNSFFPPVSYNSLSASDKRSHKWVTKFLDGLSWNSRTYPYWFLSHIIVAINFRFPLGKNYAKGKEKTESLQTLLQKEVIDLETLLCPKVEDIKSPIDNITCALHSFYLTEKQKRKHCGKRKAQLYFFWIFLPSNEPSSGEGSSASSSSELISKFDSMQLHNE